MYAVGRISKFNSNNAQMIAYELLSKLRCLTLVGYEDGQYLWLGKDNDWARVANEELKIQYDWEFNRNFNQK